MSADELADLLARAAGVGQAALGDRDHPVAYSERPQHGGMLARLGHHAVAGGDDQEEHVDAGPRRDQRADENRVVFISHRPDGWGPRFASALRLPWLLDQATGALAAAVTQPQ
jgi:hypothetical protein